MSSPVPQPGPAAGHVLVADGPVEVALGRLAALDGALVPAHVEAFDAVHRLLQDALATLDEV